MSKFEVFISTWLFKKDSLFPLATRIFHWSDGSIVQLSGPEPGRMLREFWLTYVEQLKLVSISYLCNIPDYNLGIS